MTRTIADELADVPQRAAHDYDKTYVIKLMNCVSASQVQSNACRLKIGLDLLNSKDFPGKRLGRTEWQAQKALQLDLCPRQLRTMLAAAESYTTLVKSPQAKDVAAKTLDRPLAQLRRAFNNIAAGRLADSQPEKKAAKAVTVEGIARKLGAVMALFELLADSELEDAFDAVADELEQVLPGWGREVRNARMAAASVADTSAEECKPRGGGANRPALAGGEALQTNGARLGLAGDPAAVPGYPAVTLQ